MTNDTVIYARNLNKTYRSSRGAEPVIALQDVNLEVKAGEFVSLIGPSGCGKSTLLRLIADLLTPSSGELKINGKDPHRARLEREYGMVFQAATLLEWRSVTHNVQLPLEIMGYSKAEREARAQRMLELVELGKFAHPPHAAHGRDFAFVQLEALPSSQ